MKEFSGCFKEVSRVFDESFMEEEVSRMFQGCFIFFKGVSRVFQGSFKTTFKVFQKSFMLHGTHCSFPSRRRACFSSHERFLEELGLLKIAQYFEKKSLK